MKAGSTDATTIMQEMREIDAYNSAFVDSLLSNVGWLVDLSQTADSAIFLVIQHARPHIQRKYLPMIRERAEKGLLEKEYLALLEDRVLMMSHQKQLYGSQLFTRTKEDGSRVLYVWPVEDPENIDTRRAEMGMTTMEEYLENFENAVYDKELTIEEAQ